MTSTIITIWTHHSGGLGGISPASERDFRDALARHGHAVATDSRTYRPSNHHIAGIGVGHDDAEFCEARGAYGSMAAYYENGEAFGGRWWEDTGRAFSTGVKEYGCEPTTKVAARTRRTPASEALYRQSAA